MTVNETGTVFCRQLRLELNTGTLVVTSSALALGVDQQHDTGYLSYLLQTRKSDIVQTRVFVQVLVYQVEGGILKEI